MSQKTQSTPSSARMLLVNLGGIGDVVMSLPAVEALCRWRSDQPVDMLLSDHARQLVNHSPWINRVHYLTSTRSKLDWFGVALRDWRVMRMMREQQYDYLVNLHAIHSWAGELRMRFIVRRIAPDVSVGLMNKLLGSFYDETLTVSPADQPLHKGEQAMRLAEQLGADRVVLQPHLCVNEHERQACYAFLSELGVLRGQKLVLINPSATRRARQWPLESMCAVAEWLHRQYGARVLSIGPQQKSKLGRRMEQAAPGAVVNLMGKTDLRSLMALIERAALVISNDGGIAHMAAALSTPLVCLFGETNPSYIAPLGLHSRVECVRADDCATESIDIVTVQQSIRKLFNAI